MIANHALIKTNTKNANNLTNSEIASKLIEDISQIIGTTIIDSSYHEFPPTGMSGFALLKESHISIHTWPELNLIILDILSCKGFPDNFEELTKKQLEKVYAIELILFKIEEIM